MPSPSHASSLCQESLVLLSLPHLTHASLSPNPTSASSEATIAHHRFCFISSKQCRCSLPPPEHLQLLATPTPIRSETPTFSWFIEFFPPPPFSLKSRRSPRLSPRSASGDHQAPLTIPNTKWVLLKWVLLGFGYLNMEMEIQNRKNKKICHLIWGFFFPPKVGN
jgi:hypothetical protein